MEPSPSLDPAAAPDPDHKSATRELVEEIAAGVDTAFFQPVMEQAVAWIRFAFLAVILVPIGVVGLVASFLVLAGLMAALGSPSGALATVITLGWLAGTLVAIALVFRAVYRRMPRGLRDSSVAEAARPAQWFAGGPLSRLLGGRPAPPTAMAATPARPAPTLADLDARLAPPPAPPEQPD